MWFAASFGILPFSYNSLLIIFGIGVAFLLFFILRFFIVDHKTQQSVLIKKNRKDKYLQKTSENKQDNNKMLQKLDYHTISLIVLEEIMFFFCLWLWSYIRGFQPIIEGLEKYMDFGFINSILRSKYFPPNDMWLSGYTINYYYFGHLIAAVMVLLSKIPPQIIYNLMIAVIFAMCFVSSFSLVLNIFYHFLKNSSLKKISLASIILPALLGAYLVTNAANLQTIYHLLTKGSSTYWYPDATRFIVKKFGGNDETIHEFPHYSFVVADLHGHVSDIPTVLLLIAFIFVLFLKINFSQKTENSISTSSRRNKRFFLEKFLSPFKGILTIGMGELSVYDALLLGFLLSTAYMTNAMDGPVYFLLAGITIFGAYIFAGNMNIYPLKKRATNAFLKTAVFFLFTVFVFIICSFSFLTNFKNFTGGPTLADFHSPLWMLFILWGFQFLMFFFFIVFLFGKKFLRRENFAKAAAGFFGVNVKIVSEKDVEKSNFQIVDLFIIFLCLTSLFLIIFPEVFYIKDIYIHEYQRANTMFKMTYQAFIMLYISVAYIFFRIVHYIKNHKNNLFLFPTIIFLLISFFGFFSVSIYPYFAVKSYYGLTEYKGLDGLKYLESLYPDDYALINWLNFSKTKLVSKNAYVLRPSDEMDSKNTLWPKTKSNNNLPIILEAVGDSYTKYARISANTGFSTVLGWPVHEWLWRNSYKTDGTSIGYDLPGKRTADVLKIYESENIDETKKLLKEYFVDYVWVGQLEREKYKNLDEGKFKQVGKVFKKFGVSVLYKID